MNLAHKAFMGWILYAGAVMVGILFFIVPGIIILFRCSFFPYFIIEKKAGPLNALIMSYNATRGYFWETFWFLMISKLCVYVGRLTVIGIIVAVPLTMAAQAFFYRKLLSGKHKEHNAVIDVV